MNSILLFLSFILLLFLLHPFHFINSSTHLLFYPFSFPPHLIHTLIHTLTPSLNHTHIYLQSPFLSFSLTLFSFSLSLTSVVPRGDLHALESLDASALSVQLSQLGLLVLGIRLLHSHSALGSADLIDYPALCVNDAETLAQQIRTAIEHTGTAVHALQHATVTLANTDSTLSDTHSILKETDTQTDTKNDTSDNNDSSSSGSSSSSSSSSKETFARQREELLNRHTLLLFLHALYAETQQIIAFSSATAADFSAGVAQMKELVGGKAAVPKSEVYVCTDYIFSI